MRKRQQLHQLMARWGKLRVTEGTKDEPKIIEILVNHCSEIWRWEKGTGQDAWFIKVF